MADALIERLADALVPVRPRRTPGGLWLLLILVAAEAGSLWALGGARGDLAAAPAAAGAMFWWKLAAPLLLALAATAAVLRADPTRRRVGTGALGALALGVLAVGFALARGPMGALDAGRGLACALVAAVLAVPPALALGWLLARGAPAHPRRAAIAAAIGGGAWGAALLALHCPDDTPVHSLVWHTLGVVLPAVAAAWPLARAARW